MYLSELVFRSSYPATCGPTGRGGGGIAFADTLSRPIGRDGTAETQEWSACAPIPWPYHRRGEGSGAPGRQRAEASGHHLDRWVTTGQRKGRSGVRLEDPGARGEPRRGRGGPDAATTLAPTRRSSTRRPSPSIRPCAPRPTTRCPSPT